MTSGTAGQTSRSRSKQTPRSILRRFFYENSLSVVVIVLFIITWWAQAMAGWHAYNADRQQHQQAEVNFGSYLSTGHFLEATGENWESEFLGMGTFVFLTSLLYQKGSPESKAPYEPDEVKPLTPRSPWPARRGGWVRAVYGNSLSLAFLVLFLLSVGLHLAGGARKQTEEALQHGQPPVSVRDYAASSQFWFESFQNWQSEFLSIGIMVVLSIFLRQKGSPESKAVETPHAENE